MPVALSPGLTLDRPAADRARACQRARGRHQPGRAGLRGAAVGAGRAGGGLSAAFPGVALLDEQFLAARFEQRGGGAPDRRAARGLATASSAATPRESFVLAWDDEALDGPAGVDRSRARACAPSGRSSCSCSRPARRPRATSARRSASPAWRCRPARAAPSPRSGRSTTRRPRSIIERFYAELSAARRARRRSSARSVALIETPAFRHPGLLGALPADQLLAVSPATRRQQALEACLAAADSRVDVEVAGP